MFRLLDSIFPHMSQWELQNGSVGDRLAENIADVSSQFGIMKHLRSLSTLETDVIHALNPKMSMENFGCYMQMLPMIASTDDWSV